MAYLVPDIGNDQITELHKNLYANMLSDHLRQEIPYIPHITMAQSPDKLIIEEIVNQG